MPDDSFQEPDGPVEVDPIVAIQETLARLEKLVERIAWSLGINPNG
jgi:hypothetical protein